MNKLESINGWTWIEKTKKITPFEDTYKELESWIDKKSRIPVQTSDDPIERRLGYWCSDKKKFFKKNILHIDQIEKLQSLKYWKWTSDNFDIMCNLVKNWIIYNQKFPSQIGEGVEKKYGSWCSMQRQNRKKIN